MFVSYRFFYHLFENFFYHLTLFSFLTALFYLNIDIVYVYPNLALDFKQSVCLKIGFSVFLRR